MFTKQKLTGGVVHQMPADLQKALLSAKPKIAAAWEDITPLARNEFICWVENAKHLDTRKRRITIAIDKLNRGERRPCCWVGCLHRQKIKR